MDLWSSSHLMSVFLAALAWNSFFAAILAAPVVLACRAIGPTRPAFRLTLLSLIFVRLVLPPDLAHRWSLGAVISAVRGVSPVDAVGHGLEGGAPAIASMAGTIAEDVATVASPGIPWLLVMSALWLAGFSVVVILKRRQRKVFDQVLARVRPVTSPPVIELVEEWRRRLGIRRRVRVVTGGGSAPPFTVGVVHPVVYLPEAVLSNPMALEPTIAHELAHVARFDSVWLALQNAIQAIYFFNPLVWLCGARLADERERLCDQTVLTAGRIDACRYARGLLDVLRLDLQGVGAPTMSARKRRIGVRIRNIFDQNSGRPPRVGNAVFAAAIVGLLALPMAAVPADSPSAAPEAAVSEEPAPKAEVAPNAEAVPAAPSPPTAEVAPVAPIAPGAAAPPSDSAPPAPPAPPVEPIDPPAAEAPASPESPPAPPAPPLELSDPLPGGRVTWGWGNGVSPFSKKQVFHRGIDLAAAAGTPVTAPAAGKVVVATESYPPSPNSGTVVILDNGGGYTTFFAHLDSIEVVEGQQVDAGDTIATVGSSGLSTGPHLHFEVRWRGDALDPARFVDAWQ